MTVPAHVLAAVRSIPHPRQEPDMTAPHPSPAEQAVIDRFGIFDEEKAAARPAEPTGELRERVAEWLFDKFFDDVAELPEGWLEDKADELLAGPLAPLLTKLRAVGALAERLGDESREFYYDNRHTHEYGISYVSGMSDAMEQIADRIAAAIASPH